MTITKEMIDAALKAIDVRIEYKTDGSRQSNETELIIDIYKAMRKAQEENQDKKL